MSSERKSEQRQLVVFKVGNEEFGADINDVREIIRVPDVTAVPNSHPDILGLSNIRGETITILSMRHLFNEPAMEADAETRVVVVDAGGKAIGLVVDSVTEVLRLDGSVIGEPPRMVGEKAVNHVSGIARVGERLVLTIEVPNLVELGIEDPAMILDKAA